MKTKSLVSEIFFYSVGVVFLIGFFLMLWFVATKSIPAENKDVILMLIGVLSNGVALILGYFYGSSKGSSDKNEMIKGNGTP